jgi:DNA-binding PadR family transcriptional regulator
MSVRNGLLALLAEGSRHGYELRKELEERTGALWELNVGQVYTTLARLERDGLVHEAGRGVGGDEGQEQRRYSLTEQGREELDAWFREPRRRTAPERDELVIKLALAATSDDVDLDEVIDAQRAAATEELQRYTRLKSSSQPGDLPRQFALDAVIAQIDGELRWLERCQARHRELEGRR